MKVVTVADRADLVEPAWALTRDVLSEYTNHGDVLNEYWARLVPERPDFQFHLADEGDVILARGRSIPLRRDGSKEDLPQGVDGVIARGFEQGGADALCALVIMIPRNLQGKGLSTVALQAQADRAYRG